MRSLQLFDVFNRETPVIQSEGINQIIFLSAPSLKKLLVQKFEIRALPQPGDKEFNWNARIY